MKAIILAAGVGKRLWTVTQHRPKCLIQIGGHTLLHRYLATLASLAIQRADIVVGYKQEMIRSAAEADSCGLRVMIMDGGAGFKEIRCCGHSLTTSSIKELKYSQLRAAEPRETGPSGTA